MSVESRIPYASNAEVDALIDEFNGDAREAIRALLHDLEILACDYEGSVSRGFVRGEMPWGAPTKRQA